jgi:uncharacterized protein
VRFWDASAVVPLLLEQPATRHVRRLIQEVPAAVCWWGTAVECASAVGRLRREGSLSAADESDVQAQLDEWLTACFEIQPTARVRTAATRLVRVHPLRAADVFQLAAALAWAQGSPESHAFITLDTRLAHAARLEGFQVLPH